MFLIGVAGIITCTCLLYILFKNELKGNFKTENLKNPDDVINDWLLYNIEIIVLFAAIIGCFLSSFFKYDYSIALITGALILCILYLLKGYGELKPSAGIIIVILSAIVFAALNIFFNADSKNNYILSLSNKSPYALGVEMIYGFILMIFSWIFNNITVSIGGTFFLDKVNSSFVIKEQIIYLSILLCNVGAIISPFGSVSTIIFLRFIKKVDLKMKLNEYIKMSVKTVLPVLLVLILIFSIFK
jgi:arsenical pump membrane protein